MTDQPLPTPPPVKHPPPPPQVRRASIGIFVLAALFALNVIGVIAAQDMMSGSLRTTTPELSEAEADSVATATTVLSVVFGVVAVTLLVVCGVMVRRQRKWARITVTVLLSIGLLFNLYAFLAGSPVVQVFSGIAVLLIAAVLYELWRSASTEYFLTYIR